MERVRVRIRDQNLRLYTLGPQPLGQQANVVFDPPRTGKKSLYKCSTFISEYGQGNGNDEQKQWKSLLHKMVYD